MKTRHRDDKGWGRYGKHIFHFSTFIFHLCILIITYHLSLLPSFAQSSQTRREFTSEHPLVYTDAWDLWPYSFLDDKGEPQGYNIDLVTMVMNELGIPFTIELKPTVDALEDLRDGHSDLMLGMVDAYHDNYTHHYGKVTVQLFTHSVLYPQSQPLTVHDTRDLASQRVIVHEGSFSHNLMKERGWEENASPMNDMDKAVQQVSASNSGQILWNTMSLKWLARKYHIENLNLSPVDMPSGDYRFMSNDSILLDMLDDAVNRLTADKKLIPIEQKWFYPGEKAEQKQTGWLWNIIIIIALITLALIVSTAIFKLRESKVTKEIRLRNVRLSQILNTCQIKIWTYSVDDDSFVWYDSKKQERRHLSANEFSKRYDKKDFQRLKDALKTIADRQESELQLEINAMDGDDGVKRAYIMNLSVLRSDKDGRPVTIMGTKSDVTEERKKQQKFIDMTHRYRAIFNTAMVDMVYYGKDGLILNMNQRAQKTFQMPLDAVRREGVKLSDILPEEEFKISDFAYTDRFYTTMFIDYSQEKQLESRHIKGKIDYEFKLVPVNDSQNNFIGAYGTGWNITEMTNNYRKARYNVMQLKTTMQEVTNHVNNINYALQVAGVRMVTYSPQSHMLIINHRMHEAQYVLTQQRCIELTDSDSMNTVMRVIRTMDRHTDTIIDCEVKSKLRLNGNKHLWLQLHLFPTYNKEGKVMHYSGICRDTTEMKHTEHMLMLETEKAQEVEQVKNKFLHNMCQEIRTPLDSVVNYAEKFENEHRAEDEQMFISNIKKHSTYLLDLINDILFLSRLDAHMVEINTQPCDFAQTFGSHCHMGIEKNKKDGVKYIVENQYTSLIVNIDDMNVGRIIQQVLENAVKYTDTGYVRARYEYIGGRLIISVNDTGKGIPNDALSHIFERFNTDQNSNHGTGLGLPICKELASQLGGTIDINSEVGKGTTVWITIPCDATTIEHKKEN